MRAYRVFPIIATQNPCKLAFWAQTTTIHDAANVVFLAESTDEVSFLWDALECARHFASQLGGLSGRGPRSVCASWMGSEA